jgi:hypothetical protein
LKISCLRAVVAALITRSLSCFRIRAKAGVAFDVLLLTGLKGAGLAALIRFLDGFSLSLCQRLLGSVRDQDLRAMRVQKTLAECRAMSRLLK